MQAVTGRNNGAMLLGKRSSSILLQISSKSHREAVTCTPSNVPVLRALWPLFDGILGILKGSWGVLERAFALVLQGGTEQNLLKFAAVFGVVASARRSTRG